MFIHSLPWRDFLPQAVQGREPNVRNLKFLIFVFSNAFICDQAYLCSLLLEKTIIQSNSGDSKRNYNGNSL